MRTCTKCHEEKSLEAFYPSPRHKCGYAAVCKSCESKRNKVKTELYKESRLKKAKEWKDKNPEVLKNAIQRWRDKNPDKMAQTYRDWVNNNRGKVNAIWMKRDASKKQRTPPWLNTEMKQQIEIEYGLALWCTEVMNEPYHVDHIVPLQGKTVSGLHVPWNLQVIPAKLNWQKSNRF